MAELGTLLRRYRVAAVLTQEELAERAGLGTRSLGDIERGVSIPRASTLELLLDALGLTIQERARLNELRRQHMSISNAKAYDASVLPIGRSAEIESIETLLQGGERPVLALSGEPGVGKSHLLRWAATQARAADITVFTAGCLRSGVQQPYVPLLNAVQAWEQQQTPDVLRAAFQDCGWLHRILPEAKPYLNVLAPSGSLSPEGERRVVTGALIRLLRQASGRRGALLVLDDMQWAAQDTLDMLAALATDSNSPVRILLAYRSNEARPGSGLTALLVDLAHRGVIRHVVLAPLDPQAGRELLERMGAHDLESQELGRIVERTGGVPFYLVSYAQELRHSAGPDDLPWSVSQSILQRLSMLSEEGQLVMRLASVAGRVLNPVILSAVTGVARAATLAVLDEAVTEGLVVSRRDEYVFAHDVVKEVIETDLGPGHRLGAHEAVATVLENVYATELENWYEELAYHYSRAHMPPKAFTYLVKSAHKALAAGATAEALRLCGLALDTCDSLGGNGPQGQAEVLELRGNLEFALGHYQAMAADFETVAQLRHVRSDDQRLAAARASQGTALLYDHQFAAAEEALHAALQLAQGRFEAIELRAAAVLTDLLYVTGRVREARPVFARTAALAETVADPFARAYVQVLIAPFILQWEGRFEESLEAARQASPLVESSEDLALSLWRAWHLGLTLGSCGEYEPALSGLERAVQACIRLGDSVMQARMLNTMGWIYSELGEYERAIELNELSSRIANQAGTPDPEIQNNARLNLADCLLLLGRTDNAESHLQLVERIVRQPGPQDRWMLWRYSQRLFHVQGEICLSRGELNRARQYADECLHLGYETGSRKNIVKGRRLRAEICLASGRMSEARDDIVGALQLAHEVGNPPQVWKTLLVSAQVCESMNDRGAAQTALGAAVDVINGVAVKLRDTQLRASFLASPPVRQVFSRVDSTTRDAVQ